MLRWRVCLAMMLVSQTASQQGGDEFKEGLDRPGPWVTATRGQVWPKPQFQQSQQEFFSLRSDSFNLEVSSEAIHGSCDILEAAIARYPGRIFPPAAANIQPSREEADLRRDPRYRGVLHTLEIVMREEAGCERLPHMDMSEQYQLKINTVDQPGRASLTADTVWGVLRGLETFSQLVHLSHQGHYRLNGTEIQDWPRFTHRGVLIDTSRHYIAVRVIMENLDLMEMNKFNVFHWHLTDDQSFPYVSRRFPDLSSKGAWHNRLAVYTQQDVADIIEYARLRGIRVVAEFDTPGHTQAFQPGQPGLLTECYDQDGQKNGKHGPMDPTKPAVYQFIEAFFEEITQVFPEKYLHLGGDEVDFECWRSNPDIRDFMAKFDFVGQYRLLESIYIKKLLNIVNSYPTNNGYILWQEVFDNRIQVKNDTIIHVWKDWGGYDWESEMERVTRKGLRALLSSPWYLNYISYGSDWTKYYLVEPQSFSGSQAQKSLVIGGEAAMWGEFVNSINLTPRLWPRAGAVAERLWSAAEVRDVDEAAGRLQELECRMLQRGFPVAPLNGPSFCMVDWNA